MRDEFGAKNPKSLMLRFHTQTAGVQLTAQQPEVNLVRVAMQALAAVLGGTQSLHTNSFDEAIALPTEKAARLALRTQQVIAYETDVTKTVDPFAGFVRRRVDDRRRGGGGSRADDGRSRTSAARSPRSSRASRRARSRGRRTGSRRRSTAASAIVVGRQPLHARRRGAVRAAARRPGDRGAAGRAAGPAPLEPERRRRRPALDELRTAAAGTDNVLVPMKDALRARGHRRRGLRRAARGVGRLPAAGRVLTRIAALPWRTDQSGRRT